MKNSSVMEFKEFDKPFVDLLKIFSNKSLLHYTDLDYATSLLDSHFISWVSDVNRLSIAAYNENDFVGFASAHLVMKHVTASVTIVLLKEFQNRGFSKVLMNNLIELLITKGIVRVEAQICTENQASICMIESLGFQREGLLRKNFLIDGILRDSYMYAKIIE